MVSNYTIDKCKYIHSKLKDVLYLISYEHVKNVHIDGDEVYIDELSELPLRINGFNIQFNEETSLDERYKFQKTLTLSMHGYVNYKIFGGRYYAIIEDIEGTFYMINVDFPSRITHTFNLNYNTNQTDFTFSSLSIFPTLKLNAEFEAVSPVCLGLNVYGIDKLQLIEKEKARLDTINKTVVSTEDFKTIEFLGNSCSFQEVYDGFKVTDTISFVLPLNKKIQWGWHLLEFLDNKYSAIITPKGNDNKYYPGYNFGLQPSYTIQTASNAGESDIITITLVETSSQGSTAAVDWTDEQSTETRWRWVKKVGDTICYECIGYGRARYLVRQQIDYFGNPTGNYQVMEGYESEYPNFHIVDTFTTEEIFETSDCSESESCQIESTLPNTIYFNAITCNTYTLRTSCNWEIKNIPSNITVEPMTGVADTNYTISICNTLEPTATPVENMMNLKCCKTNKVINFKTQIDTGCIRPQRQYINCLSQDVTFTFDGTCRINITSIDPKLTYSIGNNTLTVRVPRNYGDSAITWSIIATNCDCSSASTVAYINQDKQYERWVVQEGYLCQDGNSYKVERRYTGTTQDNINVRTDETRAGELITSGDTRCDSSQTKWEWDNESYYCVNGNKLKTIFEYISYDGGINWVKTGNTRLGDMVEENSEWCNIEPTYSWVLTEKWVCDDGTTPEPMYRWVNLDPSTDYYCDTTIHAKYYKQQRQVSYDSGNTWSNLNEYQRGSMYETNSVDCGYVPFNRKLKLTLSDDRTYEWECNSSTTLSQSEVRFSDIQYPISAVTDAEIGDCVTEIGEGVFLYFSGLTGVNISNSVTTIGTSAFRHCKALSSITIPNSVTTIRGSSFLGDINLLSITIPSGVTTIRGYTFHECISLESVSIEGNVTSIDDFAFFECISLNSINIPRTVTSIGDDAFYSCTRLPSIAIPDSVTSIGEDAFRICTGLTSVSIGRGITNINKSAFVGCSGLTSITIYATTPPTLGSNVFNNTNNCPIYVPASSVNTYKTASGWSDYASRITAIS